MQESILTRTHFFSGAALPLRAVGDGEIFAFSKAFRSTAPAHSFQRAEAVSADTLRFALSGRKTWSGEERAMLYESPTLLWKTFRQESIHRNVFPVANSRLAHGGVRRSVRSNFHTTRCSGEACFLGAWCTGRCNAFPRTRNEQVFPILKKFTRIIRIKVGNILPFSVLSTFSIFLISIFSNYISPLIVSLPSKTIPDNDKLKHHS